MGEQNVIDGTAEEVGTDIEHVEQQHATTLFRTDDPVEVVERASRIADALKDVLDKKGLVERIQGKGHVKVEGWQLLGSMLGVTAVCVDTEPIDGGFKATVEARTIDGRVVGRADALCTKHEKRGPWKSSDDYARLSMAQTRATSKALKGPLGFVVSLGGYQTTPAEEMTFAEPDGAGQQSGDMAKREAGRVTQEQYQAIVAAFQNAQAVSVKQLVAWLDEHNAPQDENFAQRVAGLDAPTALKLQKWLAEKGQVAA
ncbi:MAG TPA: hypothetical protein VFJ21_13910 [Mycobacteriales bacterium]|nr:hypothetical protein [Mycobacteriales bacterium]